MNEQQALQIIKQALDVATAKGAFVTVDAAATTYQAFQIIAQKLMPQITKQNDESGVSK